MMEAAIRFDHPYIPDGDRRTIILPRTFPPIVTLCGSTRFVEQFNAARRRLTGEGIAVLSIEIVTSQSIADDPQHVDPELKRRLDELHFRKIDLSDFVLVLNVRDYVGFSTGNEIDYAYEIGVPVVYLWHAPRNVFRRGYVDDDAAFIAVGEL